MDKPSSQSPRDFDNLLRRKRVWQTPQKGSPLPLHALMKCGTMTALEHLKDGRTEEPFRTRATGELLATRRLLSPSRSPRSRSAACASLDTPSTALQTMATTLQQQRELASGYLAPVVTATFFACAACGVVAALAWAYFTRFKRDRAVFKVLVGGLTLLTVVYTACMAKLAGKWAVVGVWDYSLFSRMPWEFSAYCCLTGPAVVIVQLWFSWRVWVISGRKNWILTAVIAAGSLAALGCSLRIGIFCATHAKLVDFTQVRFVLVTWLSLLIAVDLLISLAVFYYIVFKPRSDSGGLLSSDSRIQSLASFTAKTNLASLVLQILILALLLAFPTEFHFCTPSFLVTGVYVGSFIATLLARDPATLRSSGGGTDPPWAGSGPAELPSFVLRMGGASEMPEMARREPERGAVALEMEEGRRPFDTMLSLSGTRHEHGPASVENSGSSSSSEMMLPRLSYEGRGLAGVEGSKPERGK